MGWVVSGDVSCNVGRGGWVDACRDVGWDVGSDDGHNVGVMSAATLEYDGCFDVSCDMLRTGARSLVPPGDVQDG